MKRLTLLFVLCALLLCSTASAAAYSANMLSPGLRILADAEVMIRSGVVSGEISFSPDDFLRAVGGDIPTVTVTALPPASDGTLMFGSSPVVVNQSMKLSSVSSLRFVPAKGCTSSSFRFKAGGEYSMECLLKYTDCVNAPPVAGASKGDVAVWTQRDITTYGTLSATDPENDALVFEITKYPENGILELLSQSGGDYRYTPCDGVMGSDSFTYTVRDEWGNYASEVTVLVDIDRELTDLVFADMEGHWAHNAALVMAAENIMDVSSDRGALYFHPDREITREDFLVTVMKALGAGEISPADTVFADDSEISEEASGYIARAYDLGVIKGSSENSLLCFHPKDSITRAEAAVILNAILGAGEPETVPVFADNSAVPAWAKGSLYALTNAGIFNGTGAGNLSPNDKLSRAQTAQILLTVKKLYQ